MILNESKFQSDLTFVIKSYKVAKQAVNIAENVEEFQEVISLCHEIFKNCGRSKIHKIAILILADLLITITEEMKSKAENLINKWQMQNLYGETLH